MKKIFVLLFVCAFTGSLFSQSLKVLDVNNNDISNTTVTVTEDASAYMVYFYAHVQNVSGVSLQTLVCRQVVFANGMTNNSFCYGPHCYISDTANFSVILDAGEIDSSFDATVYFSGAGVTQIIYTFWDKNNPTDKVSITVNYDITTSIEANNFVPNFLSNPYPVPASDYVYFNCNMEKEVQLEIYDVIGKTILKKSIAPSQNKIEILVNGLKSGIYNYSLLIDDIKTKAGRFIVK